MALDDYVKLFRVISVLEDVLFREYCGGWYEFVGHFLAGLGVHWLAEFLDLFTEKCVVCREDLEDCYVPLASLGWV